jgi:beta-glucosidase
VEAWYPGQAGGTALADVLFGDYNPAGRLPVTFYSSASQIPAFDNYNMTGKTYRFFSGEPVFGFGYGLSYTTFAYRHLVTPRQGSMSKPIHVSVDVENTGTKAGEEVAELYLLNETLQKDTRTRDNRGEPLRSLDGFERIALAPHQQKTLQFTLKPEQFPRPGTYDIYVGGAQPGNPGVQMSTIEVGK